MNHALRRKVNEDIITISDVLPKAKQKYRQHWNSRQVKYSQLLCPQCGTPFTCIAFKQGKAKLLCGHWRGADITEKQEVQKG